MGTEQLLDVDEAAEAIGCGRRYIYRLVKEGKLRASKVDGRGSLRFRPAWILDFVEGAAPAVSTAPPTKSGEIAHA